MHCGTLMHTLLRLLLANHFIHHKLSNRMYSTTSGALLRGWTTMTLSVGSRHLYSRSIHRQATVLAAAANVERLGLRRAFSSIDTATTAPSCSSADTTITSGGSGSVAGSGPSSWTFKDPVQLDTPFLEMVRQRLEEKDDTSAYFKHCKEDPVRQAGVFMVKGETQLLALITE